jgi:glycosyltransferase involved in cell wall biosynthesis
MTTIRAATSPPERTIWVDMEDFFRYFGANPRPSGIQRLVFEILRVLPQRAALLDPPNRVAFVRHGGGDLLLREISFASIEALFETTASAANSREPISPSEPKGIRRVTAGLRLAILQRIAEMPAWASEPLLTACIMQVRALRSPGLFARRIMRSRAKVPQDRVTAANPAIGTAFGGHAGDVFLMLGAPWTNSSYGTLLRRLRTAHGIEPALLLYDLIPVRRPEWCAAQLVESFAAWLDETLPVCSRLMAISHATARDVANYAAERGVTLAGGITPIPIGTGFGLGDIASHTPPRGLPPSGSYVLFVSTLEARKNHALLVSVWRRLLNDLPRDQVPTLVFAGRVGWLVSDLMQQLENAEWFGGKIRLLRNPTDAELVALYQGCQFSVFPSLFEGWGLPVSESLALGCPCICANGTSLPESGGELARYFNPENVSDAYDVIRGVIEDAPGLAGWRARVRSGFLPVPWERTADAILAACLPETSASARHPQDARA